MPLYATTVVMPYRLEERDEAPIFTCQVDSAASNPQVALSTAKLLTRINATLQHGREPLRILTERAQIGNPTHTIEGPYIYLFTHGDRIPQLSFPRRIGDQASTELEQTLAGFDPALLHGAVMDCAQLSYINTQGLTAFVAHAKRCGLQLCRLPPPLRKVMDIVGLGRLMTLHDDLRSALHAILDAVREQRTRLDEHGFQRRL